MNTDKGETMAILRTAVLLVFLCTVASATPVEAGRIYFIEPGCGEFGPYGDRILSSDLNGANIRTELPGTVDRFRSIAIDAEDGRAY